MYSSRKTKILNIICVLLVLMTGVIRLTRDSYRLVSSNIQIFFLFIGYTITFNSLLNGTVVYP